jgi:hypothetical protein
MCCGPDEANVLALESCRVYRYLSKAGNPENITREGAGAGGWLEWSIPNTTGLEGSVDGVMASLFAG